MSEHRHAWGDLERSRFAGTLHRKCQVQDCNAINALDDDDDVMPCGCYSGSCYCDDDTRDDEWTFEAHNNKGDDDKMNEDTAMMFANATTAGDVTTKPRGFDWDNNRRVTEYELSARNDEFGAYEVQTPWTRNVASDLDGFVKTFEAENVEARVDWDDERETPDTVRAVSVTFRTWRIRLRERSVYPGLYDNVSRLLDFLKHPSGDDHSPQSPPETVDRETVIDALTMILCHDRGERDAQAPEGHCRHGVRVGGMGIDWMCGACEDGAE